MFRLWSLYKQVVIVPIAALSAGTVMCKTKYEKITDLFNSLFYFTWTELYFIGMHIETMASLWENFNGGGSSDSWQFVLICTRSRTRNFQKKNYLIPKQSYKSGSLSLFLKLVLISPPAPHVPGLTALPVASWLAVVSIFCWSVTWSFSTVDTFWWCSIMFRHF